MHKFFMAALAASTLALSFPASSLAVPQNNGDGSKTCNASGPSGDPVVGVCANTIKTNEDMCDGGMSSEPGGGITCAESRSGPSGVKLNKAAIKQRR